MLLLARLGLGSVLELDLVHGWLVVMHTYLCDFSLSLSHCRPIMACTSHFANNTKIPEKVNTVENMSLETTARKLLRGDGADVTQRGIVRSRYGQQRPEKLGRRQST